MTATSSPTVSTSPASIVAAALVVSIVLLIGQRAAPALARSAARRRLARHASLRRRGHVFRAARRLRARGSRPIRGGAVGGRAVAAWLDELARRCGSGHTLSSALLETPLAAGTSPAIPAAVDAVRAGSSLQHALAHVAASSADEALAVHVLRLAATQGGNVSEPLDRAAATLRERDAFVQEREAQSAQARLSARVLTWLPLAFSGWSMATSASVQRFVLSGIGLVSVGVGLALNRAGSRWMTRTIAAS